MAEFKSLPLAGKVNEYQAPLVQENNPTSYVSLKTLALEDIVDATSEVRNAPPSWRKAFEEIGGEVGPLTVFQIGQLIGRFGFIELGSQRAKLVCVSRSRCDSDQRLITDMARKSASRVRAAVITHDPTQPCRQKGGASCTYLVSW